MVLLKDTLRQHLEKVFANQELAQWFDPLAIAVDEDKKLIRVSFPHAFFGQWFMKARRNVFERQLSPFINDMRIVYEGGGDGFNGKKDGPHSPAGKPDVRALSGTSSFIRPAEVPVSEQFGKTEVLADDHTRLSTRSARFLLEHHRFETFIGNRKNDFPLAAAHQAVEKALSPSYTPFVIHGQSGAGKTHLLGAMANALLSTAPGVPFFHGGVDYLDRIQLSPSRSAPIQEQVIFIDDIQRAYRSSGLQDALVSLIDFSHGSRLLLVLCADAHPANSPGVNAKLLSRLTGGLVVELKKPDLDVRRQYLQQKNSTHNLGLSKEHILSLAQHHQDIRSIDGFLTRISAYRSLLNNQDGVLDNLFEHGLGEHPDRRLLTPELILDLVAKQFSVNMEDITGKKRDKSVSLARPVAMLLCRELLGLSLVQVGRIFGGRDHSSVLYSLHKIKTLQESDKDTNSKVTTLKQMCLTGR